MKLTKYLSCCGACSQKVAGKLIQDKLILVNEIVAQHGCLVSEQDKIKIKGVDLIVWLNDETSSTKIHRFLRDYYSIDINSAEKLVRDGRVVVNGFPARTGQRIRYFDEIQILPPYQKNHSLIHKFCG